MATMTAANLIKIAAAEIGYKEKSSNASLDDKTANAGSNNWTKYARDLYSAGYYNGNKNGYAWCDVFVDWCFYQLAGKNATKAQEIECQTGDCGAGCVYSARYYRNQNRFYTSNPQVGDQIFFGSTGNEEHTGIVETVNGNSITTIEGNSSDQVARRSYTTSNSRIVGYGRPKFEETTTSTTSTASTSTTAKEETTMSNSSLVSYTKISPNKTSPRNHTIDTITIHCVVGQCSVETLGSIFAPTSRQASSNYGIGSDGRVGMYVEEKDRSWCSSNAANDNRAITIEVASDTVAPYAVNDKAYNTLIELVTDICKRNGIKKLVWSTNKNDRVNHLNGCNMTVHRDYANKSCPGDYLYNRHGDIAAKVNAKLGVTTNSGSGSSTGTTTVSLSIKVGDVIKLKEGATYSSGKSIPSWVFKTTLYAREIRSSGQVVFSTQKTGAVTGVVNSDQIVVESSSSTASTSSSTTATSTSYLVRITASALNIRKGPGTSYSVVGCIRDKGIYTIVAEQNGWGKLKSGAGWISLSYTSKV